MTIQTRQDDELRRAAGRAESRARLAGRPHVARHYALLRLSFRREDRHVIASRNETA